MKGMDSKASLRMTLVMVFLKYHILSDKSNSWEIDRSGLKISMFHKNEKQFDRK